MVPVMVIKFTRRREKHSMHFVYQQAYKGQRAGGKKKKILA